MSCTKTIEPTISDSAQELVVLAEIQSGILEPVISLNSTFNNNLEDIKLSETIRVEVFVNDEESPKSFRALGDDLTSWRATPELIFQEGNTYKMYIDASEFGFPIVEATTFVPRSAQMIQGELSSPNLFTTNLGMSTQFENSFQIERKEESEGYYHLIPYLKLADGSILNLNVEEITESENSVLTMEHRYGILIDESLINESNVISTVLSLSQDIENIDLESDNIYFELRTVTEDYFKYHRSVSLNVQSSSSPFTLPTLTYTNFSSGYGLFATYSTSLDSIAFIK